MVCFYVLRNEDRFRKRSPERFRWVVLKTWLPFNFILSPGLNRKLINTYSISCSFGVECAWLRIERARAPRVETRQYDLFKKYQGNAFFLQWSGVLFRFAPASMNVLKISNYSDFRDLSIGWTAVIARTRIDDHILSGYLFTQSQE